MSKTTDFELGCESAEVQYRVSKLSGWRCIEGKRKAVLDELKRVGFRHHSLISVKWEERREKEQY